MKILLISPFLLVATVAHAYAQVEATPIQTALGGPFIQKRAPDFACWSITPAQSKRPGVQSKEAGDSAITKNNRNHSKPEQDVARSNRRSESKDLTSAIDSTRFAASSDGNTSTITKTGKMIHVERTDEQKKTWHVWITAGRELSMPPNGGTVEEVAPPPNTDTSNPLYTDFSKTDFPGFEWLSAQNFAGVKLIRDQPCLVFEEKNANLESNETSATDSAKYSRYAAVDYYSRLPAALGAAGVLQEYTFKFPPQAMQTLPEAITRFLQLNADERKATDRTPSKPY